MQLPAIVEKCNDGEAGDGGLGQTPAGGAFHFCADDGLSAKELKTSSHIRHVVRQAMNVTVSRLAPGERNFTLFKHLRPRKSSRII
ncbi:hypothetical protein M2321_002313 [Rhodoblastus acidophilus]|nr:hypothetical protein [Rhodoblastus acidophilus]